MKFNKLTSALMVFAVVGVTALPVSSAFAAPDAAKIAERKARKSQAVGEKVGKAIAKAYELYNANQIAEAIALLEPIQPTSDFDKAFRARFLGSLYAEKNPAKAARFLEEAVKLDVLSFADHSAALKTLADITLMGKEYEKAIKLYKAWLDFTGELNPDVEMRIANCYYELKQFANIIPHADKAIAYFKEPKKAPFDMKYYAYYELKQNKKAIEVLETIVTLFPQEKMSWISLGQFYAMDEQYDRALAIFSMAYKQGYLTKENEIKLLSQLYSNNNVPYKSAALLEKHMKAGLVKKDRANMLAIASSYNAARDFKKAAAYFGELAQAEKDGDLYRRQGNALLLANQTDAAVTALLKALENGVKDKGKVHADLLVAYFDQGKLKEANRHAQLARDNGQAKFANGWSNIIRQRAEKKGISL